MTTGEVAVDQGAGADVGRLLDMRLEVRVPRQLARMVVVEIADRCPGVEEPEQIVAIPVERDVEHRDLVAGVGMYALQQPDVALDAGDELRVSAGRPAVAVAARTGRRRRR